MSKKEEKLNKEIDKIFKDCPKTEDLLTKVENMDFPPLDEDPEFVAGIEMGKVQEKILQYIEENNLLIGQLENKLYGEWSEMPIKDVFEIVMSLGKELTIRIKE